MTGVHLRLPDGTLACGADHRSFASYNRWPVCCRLDPSRVSCPDCLNAAHLSRQPEDQPEGVSS